MLLVTQNDKCYPHICLKRTLYMDHGTIHVNFYLKTYSPWKLFFEKQTHIEDRGEGIGL